MTKSNLAVNVTVEISYLLSWIQINYLILAASNQFRKLIRFLSFISNKRQTFRLKTIHNHMMSLKEMLKINRNRKQSCDTNQKFAAHIMHYVGIIKRSLLKLDVFHDI